MTPSPLEENQPANILVVDDTPANLQLLVGMLKDRGYKVRPVPNGELALRAARSQTPDLILLDITMPDIDGFEVCRRLKSSEALRDVPVLFISALNETSDKVRAFETGGVDYVTKPFQFEEVEARVRTHLELRRKEKQLEESYARLRDLEQARDSLTHMIVHDMRSSLLALQLSWKMLHPTLPADDSTASQVVRTGDSSIEMLVDMTNQILDVSRMEAGQMELRRTATNPGVLIREILTAHHVQADHKRVNVSAPAAISVHADPHILRRIIANLVANALKFTERDGEIRITVSAAGPEARIEVADNGPGIELKDQNRIFQKFAQVGGPKSSMGSGLGLTFVRLAVEAHGGQVGVRSTPGQGSTFWFTIPLHSPAESS